jgi:8-oxo-dGTP pyrophosphatase MutT (NUDIX family)
MITVVGRIGTSPKRLIYRDFRLERKGFLSIVTYAIDGFRHRFELMERGQAVVVLPIDFERRELYLLTELRPNKPLGTVGHARAIIRSVLDGTADPAETFDVPATMVRVYEMCAGMIDLDPRTGQMRESPEEAAVRELREETGLVIDESRLIYVDSYFPSVGGSTEIVHLYFADLHAGHAETREEAKGDGGENIEILHMSWDDAFGLLRDFKIKSSSAGLLLRELKIRDLQRPLPK